ncbi:hypothetical protein MHK_006199 [Candidatus Magnetomorum sp. HK-1]|nr:hypothetical protein MHK_006199 [Candidatus Magnetomorum sp. HK-1]
MIVKKTGITKYYLRYFMLLILISLPSCQTISHPPCDYKGQSYGQPVGEDTNQWFDDYERAVSYMEGKCYRFALTYFLHAIHFETEDDWWVLTYGMRYMEYFPHRESAIALYHLKRYDEALKMMNQSIMQEPSAKAFFYLDKIRKALFRKEKLALKPPEIKIKHQKEFTQNGPLHIWTHQDPFQLAGQVTAYHFVSKIIIDKNPILITSSKKKIEFQHDLSLNEGTYPIKITAETLLHEKTQKEVFIHVDRSGPMILIETFSNGQEIKGKLTDASDGLQLTINEKPIFVDALNQWQFHYQSTIPHKKYVLKASDRLGNSTEAMLIPFNDSVSQQAVFIASYPTVVSDSKRLAYIHKKNPLTISIDNFSTNEIVYKKHIRVQGQIQSTDGIKSFHMTVHHEKRQTFEKQSKDMMISILLLNQSIHLEPGLNIVRLIASDKKNRKIVKTLTFNRLIPKIYDISNRIGLALQPFTYKNQINSYNQQVQKSFIQEFIQQKRFQLIPRGELTKQKGIFSKDISDNIHPFMYLTGSVYITEKWVQVVIKITHVETGEILIIKDVYDEFDHHTPDESIILAKINDLSQKIHQAIPIIQGDLIQSQESSHQFVQLDLKPLTNDWPFIVYYIKHHDPLRGSDCHILGKTIIKEKINDHYYSIQNQFAHPKNIIQLKVMNQ